jgi:nucleoside-diphosphate-sugar epimerase
MRVLIAGATGVIGRQAVPRLAAAGHEVIGISRTGRAPLAGQLVTADLLDPDALTTAVCSVAPDAVVHVATAIPDPINLRHIAREMALTNRLRTEGTANLIAAARTAGVERIVAEGYAPAYDPAGDAVCDEDQPLWRDPPRQYAPVVAALRDLERQVVAVDGLVLRFGHLYGPGSTFATDGATISQIREGKVPLVGEGGAIFSFVHAADAGSAIVAAVESDVTGVLNVADDDPTPLREWLPEVARSLDAPEPKHVPALVARFAVGPFGLAFMTELRGADNRRAREHLGWAPDHATWRGSLPRELTRGSVAAAQE